MPLYVESHKVLTVVFPSEVFECLTLSQSITPATDIVQARMVSIFSRKLDIVPIPYLENVLYTKGEIFEDCLQMLNIMLGVLWHAQMQLNAEKSKCCAESINFLDSNLQTCYQFL